MLPSWKIARARVGFRVLTGGAATHLLVIAPKQVTAGQAFTVEVEALDSANRVSAGFTGPVQLSLGTADSGATLPGYTFTTADHGVHFFQVTLTLAGSQTIVAAGGKITGGAPTAVKPGSATHFQVTAASGASVGAATSVTVAAMDADNNVVTSFTGAVTLSGANSNLLPSYTFVAADHGMHTFNVTFTSAGSETVSATAASNAAMTGSTTVVVASPASQGYYGNPSYYGTGYYENPAYYGAGYYGSLGYYGAGYYGNLGYYGTGYYGNLGYYGTGSYLAPAYYGGLSYYGAGWNCAGIGLLRVIRYLSYIGGDQCFSTLFRCVVESQNGPAVRPCRGDWFR